MNMRQKTDPKIVASIVSRNIRLLRYLCDNHKSLLTGKLESPQKVMVFYSAFVALRSLWEAKTNKGKNNSGSSELDKEMKKNLRDRIDWQVCHAIGNKSKPLLRTKTFKHWVGIALKLWEPKKKIPV